VKNQSSFTNRAGFPNRQQPLHHIPGHWLRKIPFTMLFSAGPGWHVFSTSVNIFDFTDLVGRRRIPKGNRLAIVTNAGGPGVMATDSLISLGGKLVQLSDETMKS
jgi:hypothetical protein